LAFRTFAPQAVELSFEDWWENISKRVSGQGKKGLNSIIILGVWTLWNHRNHGVFDGVNPSLSSIVSVINEELLKWSFAGLEEFLSSSPKHLQTFKSCVPGRVVSKSKLVLLLVKKGGLQALIS
jgi:hypothetical protein